MSTPALSIGTMMTEMPRWRAPVGSVRTQSHSCVARGAPLFQILVPLITHYTPSRVARVRRFARSVPASGAE
jgi:hypothetical protein